MRCRESTPAAFKALVSHTRRFMKYRKLGKFRTWQIRTGSYFPQKWNCMWGRFVKKCSQCSERGRVRAGEIRQEGAEPAALLTWVPEDTVGSGLQETLETGSCWRCPQTCPQQGLESLCSMCSRGLGLPGERFGPCSATKK